MLGHDDAAARELMQRVHIVAAARRPVEARFFETIGSALSNAGASRCCTTRAPAAASRREVSPQRLTHYRNTWYLDAWCHRSEAAPLRAGRGPRGHHAGGAREGGAAVQVRAALDGGYGVFAAAA